MMETLIVAILSGAVTGGFMGVILGLMAALFSRDGIYPNFWAGLVLFGMGIGTFISLLDTYIL